MHTILRSKNTHLVLKHQFWPHWQHFNQLLQTFRPFRLQYILFTRSIYSNPHVLICFDFKIKTSQFTVNYNLPNNRLRNIDSLFKTIKIWNEFWRKETNFYSKIQLIIWNFSCHTSLRVNKAISSIFSTSIFFRIGLQHCRTAIEFAKGKKNLWKHIFNSKKSTNLICLSL